ncbi:hypothetical protein D3C71_898370 [compost metagenome]
MGGEIVGCRTCGGRHHHAVADQLFQPHLAIHLDTKLGGLMGLAKQADLVHGEGGELVAVGIRCRHAQGVKIIAARHRDALEQAFHPVVIHQEADGPPVHAIDTLAGIHRLVENLQHEAIAAECNDHLRLCKRRIAVNAFQHSQRRLRLLCCGGDEGQ